MSKFAPEKLTVEFRDGVTKTRPMIPRRYTLTHSDTTAELFLTIGLDFAFDKLSEMRDEVLGEWSGTENGLQYNVYLHVGGEPKEVVSVMRYNIFQRELPLALEAIHYGDRRFFQIHPELDHRPIIVFFVYDNPEDNKMENWGSFTDYGG